VSHTLLLADDSITIQRVIELTFADEDIRVVAVGDGHEAIARIDETPPDIVLADVEMPGTDGYEVARHIRTTPRLAHIPVLLLTGAFEPVDQAKVADAGCQGVLTKPFEPQLVIQRVRELLAGTAPQAASTGPHGASRQAPARVEAERRPGAAASTNVDDYFEQLDAALTTLPGASSARPRPQSTQPPLPTPPHISLADAFAALLAAEQTGSARPFPAGWQVPQPGGGVISEALVDEIVRRVLERISHQMVRETVSEVVLDVAERLVREEIERIKGSVR
jgi:CheY-like chemotaxis protein